MPHDSQASTGGQPPKNEAPGTIDEADIPSDGKDEKGEQMIEELGRDKPGPELSGAEPGKK